MTGRVLAMALSLTPVIATAGEADVVEVDARREADGSYHFQVSVRHADSGWDHYADRWDVVAPDGAVLGVRVLHHPHVDEQPFTRSLSGVRVAPGTTAVTVRVHDLVHGFGGREITVPLPP